MFNCNSTSANFAIYVTVLEIDILGLAHVLHLDALIDHDEDPHPAGRTARFCVAGVTITLTTFTQQVALRGSMSLTGMYSKLIDEQ